jgi:predicted metal-dependent hydrolase
LLNDKQYSLLYGDELINYMLRLKESDSHKIVILVQPDTTITVTAPQSATMDEIDRALSKRAKWISRKVAGFKSHERYTLKRTYKSGESHFYLGRRYMLKINVDDSLHESVKIFRGQLHVYVKENSAEKVKKHLLRWYKKKAYEVFNAQLDELLLKTPWVNARPNIKIKSMETQWGSCSPKGEILLNPHLIKANKTSIEYVLLHELCHLAEHNHSERFYRLLEQVLPNWREIKDALDSKATYYLNI